MKTRSTSYAGRPAAIKRVALLLVAASIGVVPVAAHADPVDDYVAKAMAEKSIPGLVVAVLRDGHVVKEKAYGYANLELKVPTTLDTSFFLASTTKIFTATAIMQLVERGKLSLDEPLRRILRTLPAAWANVTIRNCLEHTSGLPYATEDEINATAIEGDRDRLMAKLAEKPVKVPGTAIDYNTTDYVLLAMVIEAESGLAYTDYIERFLLDPAGMKTARFGDAWSIIPNRVDLYTNVEITADHKSLRVVDGQPVPLKTGILRYGHKIWPDFMQPVAGLNGTIRDLVAWEAALASNTVINTRSLAEMERPEHFVNGKEEPFGLGFLTTPAGSISYGGGAAVWRIKMPSKHLTVIVLTNLQGCAPEILAADIAALYDRT